MIDYATQLGADCPFFIVNRPSYAEGIGEKLQPVSLDLKGWYLAVVRPAIPVSTKEAFSLITPQHPVKNCRDIVLQPVETWREQLVNDFEKSVFAIHPEIGAIKERGGSLCCDVWLWQQSVRTLPQSRKPRFLRRGRYL